jgi:hypothetical protein
MTQMNKIITTLVVMAIVLGVGIVAQTTFAQSPTLSDRCVTQFVLHAAAGGAHGEEAERILEGFCSQTR